MTAPFPLVLVGPSGVGKSTLYNLLEKNHPGIFGFSVSHTTRQPRQGEVNNVNYHFVDVQEFEKLIDENKFIEYANVHGNYYGTTIDAVQAITEKEKYCVLDIDYVGAQNVKKACLKPSPKFVFILPPSREVLRTRLVGRGTETSETIQRRLQTAEAELDFFENNKDFFDASIINDNLEDAYNALEAIIFN